MGTQVESIQELSKQKGFKVVHFNVRSLTKKIDQCRILFEGGDIDIITISETWLKQCNPDPTIDIGNYFCIRQDRNLANTTKKRGGGLATYIHRKHLDLLQNLVDLSDSNTNYEAMWIKLDMPQCRDIVVCNLYRPPGSKIDKCTKYLERCLASLNTSKTDIFIIGDFNIHFGNNKTQDFKKLSFDQFNQLHNRFGYLKLQIHLTNGDYTDFPE